MKDVVDFVTREVGTEPVPYELEGFGFPGIKQPTNCLLWKLPPPAEDDKSILQLDAELTEKLYKLVQETPDSAEIQELAKKTS